MAKAPWHQHDRASDKADQYGGALSRHLYDALARQQSA